MKERKIILFDGVCNLCNSSVNFIIDRDKSNQFKFASLQSEAGKSFLRSFNIENVKLETLFFLYGNKCYDQSTAVLKVVKYFPGLWKLFYIFIIIPKPLRDFFYKIIAKNRYKWFGKKDSCRVPTPELKEKFL